MAYVDIQRGFLRFKIIYCGPEESGATSNIEHLKTLTKGKVEVLSLATRGETTTPYEYMPLQLGKVRGLDTTLNLYTAPGKGCDADTMRFLLEDIDGVIFVVDSREAALHANVERLEQLRTHVEQAGASLDSLPVVLQYNKRDLADALPVAALDEALNRAGWPTIEASAKTGENVKETLTLCSQMIYQKAVRQYGLAPSDHPPGPAETPRTEEEERQTVQFAEGKETLPPRSPAEGSGPDPVSRGMAEQIGRSLPPWAAGAAARAPRRDRGTEPVALSDLFDLLSEVEEQLAARCDKTDAMVYRVAEKQAELKSEIAGIRDAIAQLTETLAKAIRANLDSKFAEYIEDLTKDKR